MEKIKYDKIKYNIKETAKKAGKYVGIGALISIPFIIGTDFGMKTYEATKDLSASILMGTASWFLISELERRVIEPYL